MDPVRLLDQPDLPARERAALEAGRGLSPAAYDVEAGAARLAGTLGGGGTSGGAAASVASKLGGKVVVAGVLTSIAFVASLQMRAPRENQSGATRSGPPLVQPTPSPRAAPAPFAVAPAVIAAPASTAPAAPEPSIGQPRKRAPRIARPAAFTETSEEQVSAIAETNAPREAATTEASPDDPVLDEERRDEPPPSPSPAMLEIKAIAGAKRALSDDQPKRALSILVTVARDFPRGYFIEERRALRVLALAADGESEQARREAESFLRDYPAGAFTHRVKAAKLR